MDTNNGLLGSSGKLYAAIAGVFVVLLVIPAVIVSSMAPGSLLTWVLVFAAVSAVACMGVVNYLTQGSGGGGVQSIAKVLSAAAAGDLKARASVGGGEAGAAAKSLNDLLEKLQGMAGGISSGMETVSTFTEGFLTSASQIADNSETMKSQSGSITGEVDQVTTRFNAMASSAEEMSASVNTVATAIEEMSASLTEVARNCQRESQVSASASDQSRQTQSLMERLGGSAKSISNVVKVINKIADQTNLLALNATIEAASAGDAGKGFAVVANEVKELAKQTAQATDEITRQIEEMQNNTTSAIQAMSSISTVIEEVNQISQTIVSAVEEQSATITEIARSVSGARQAAVDVAKNTQQSAQSMGVISTAVKTFSSAASATAEDIGNVRSGAKKLSRLVLSLQNLVAQLTNK